MNEGDCTARGDECSLFTIQGWFSFERVISLGPNFQWWLSRVLLHGQNVLEFVRRFEPVTTGVFLGFSKMA